jgi:hypothetical protein
MQMPVTQPFSAAPLRCLMAVSYRYRGWAISPA